ncbi:hypothetical protein F4802DRAFT_592422 [Xylaria palmicola]|nr:hypothetical protein F4802DRAFT_592422 [Xylaria palmicola]
MMAMTTVCVVRTLVAAVFHPVFWVTIAYAFPNRPCLALRLEYLLEVQAFVRVRSTLVAVLGALPRSDVAL